MFCTTWSFQVISKGKHVQRINIVVQINYDQSMGYLQIRVFKPLRDDLSLIINNNSIWWDLISARLNPIKWNEILPHLVPDYLHRLSMAPSTQIVLVAEFYHLLNKPLEKRRLENKQKLSKTEDSSKTFSRENLVALGFLSRKPLIFYLKELGGTLSNLQVTKFTLQRTIIISWGSTTFETWTPCLPQLYPTRVDISNFIF